MNFLIAEETFELLDYLREYIVQSGHSVYCANDGEEALTTDGKTLYINADSGEI